MLQDAYINNFLEIPVVLGIMLCKEKFVTNAYFKELIQESSQKKELASSIRSIIFNLPENTDFQEFSVKDYYAYLYRLNKNHRILVLVLHENNVVKSFRAKQLCQKLQEDINLTVKIFNDLLSKNLLPKNPILADDLGDKKPSEIAISHNYSSKPNNEIELSLILASLNYLSKFSCNFLGSKIVSNFWNISRPDNKWLLQFEIKLYAEIIFSGDPQEKVGPIAVLNVREWTRQFMNQCCQLIRDLPERLEKENMNEDYRKIISIYTSEYLKDIQSLEGDSGESLFDDALF